MEKQQRVSFREAMCLRCCMEHCLPVEELADKLMTPGFMTSSEYKYV
jgi:hypothetical protein